MRKNIVISMIAVTLFAIAGFADAQQGCNSCVPSDFPPNASCVHAGGSVVCRGFNGIGANVLNDKLVKPFHYGLSACPCRGTGTGCVPLLGHGCVGRLLGRNVPCAGNDHYNYTPGYGANGQGFYPGASFGFHNKSAYPSYQQGYTYRSPRDFLNPNPPTIGY
jgi:hypothetical protein